MLLGKNLGNVIVGDEPTGDEFGEHLVLEVAGEGIRVSVHRAPFYLQLSGNHKFCCCIAKHGT